MRPYEVKSNISNIHLYSLNMVIQNYNLHISTNKSTGESWRSLYNEDLHNLQTSLNVIRMIKSRIPMGWDV